MSIREIEIPPLEFTNRALRHVYYEDFDNGVTKDGLIERYVTRYLNGMLTFVTTHFSDYAIVYDATVENETGKEETVASPEPAQTGEPAATATPEAGVSPTAVPTEAPTAVPTATPILPRYTLPHCLKC